MSSQSITEIETESPPLFNYLKQEIPLEDLKDYASPRRITSIDFLKGFAIIFVILAHTAQGWLAPDSDYLYGLLFALLDILGPSLFVFLSALSVIFSIKRKEGIIHPKIIRNRILTRGLVMIIIGMITNIVVIQDGVVKVAIYGWNIITFIGFSQVFSYYILKIRKSRRIIIGLLIIFLSPALRAFIYMGKSEENFIPVFRLILSFLHYIITSPTPHLTLLPWVSICFISTIFGEYIYEAMNKGTTDAYIGLFRIFFVWGIIFVLIGIFLYYPNGLNFIEWQPGWYLQTPISMEEIGGISEYPQLHLLEVANKQDFFEIPGMPSFLIRGTSANMFYNQGMALLIISIFFYYIDIKKNSNNFTNMLIYYGKTSLSLFLIHFLFIPLFFNQYNVAIFLIVSLSYIGFLGIFMYFWMEYANGVGSPEWLMIQLGRIGQKSGEAVKKTTKKVYNRLKKERVKKMEDFMKKLSKDESKEDNS
ncbi:MAG: heparan-alpha-glucosaminide N-acetyltransferase domain-containing protein [Candidatus Odinarchaeota archaeon]